MPAWLTILDKGFAVSKLLIGEQEMFVAKKGELEFLAEDTLTLLGLISMHEVRGVHWQATDSEIDDYMLLDEG